MHLVRTQKKDRVEKRWIERPIFFFSLSVTMRAMQTNRPENRERREHAPKIEAGGISRARKG